MRARRSQEAAHTRLDAGPEVVAPSMGMDPSESIAGLTIERYAELAAEVAVTRGDHLKMGEAFGRAGVTSTDWQQAHAGWSARLVDPGQGPAVVGVFERHYHAQLDKILGAPPDVPPDDFIIMLGEALMMGSTAMTAARGIDELAWSRISYRGRSALAEDPARMAARLAVAGQVAERRLSKAVPVNQGFERDASVAAKAVGKAVFSGLDAFGAALDGVGKSLFKIAVGKPVLVQWSDGKQYPGTVAQVGKDQYLVTMADGSQRWVPEAYVKSA